MKYIYFVRYTTPGNFGMAEYMANQKITSFSDIEQIADALNKNQFKGKAGTLVIDNYQLLRTEGE